MTLGVRIHARKVKGGLPDWAGDLLEEMRVALGDDPNWSRRLQSVRAGSTLIRIHLAIFVEPYLSFILDGSKTVESRFSVTKCAPYGRVGCGDIVMLKRAGGPVTGVCLISNVWSYELDPQSWDHIKKKFSRPLRIAGAEFWEQRRSAQFATLMMISDVCRVAPINIRKKDRRGWVIVHSGEQGRLNYDDNNVLR